MTFVFTRSLISVGFAASISFLPIAAHSAVGDVKEVACPDYSIQGSNRCVEISVLEDPKQKNSREIPVFAFILKSTSATPAPDPLFYFVGGPGGSASTRPELVRGAGAFFRRDRDVVFLDQRGTGRSGDLSCDPQSNMALKKAVKQTANDKEILEACFALHSKTRNLSAYTTTNTIEDYEVVRKALGYNKINLFGASYGTRIGLEYARLHPGIVRSGILFGVAPPSIDLFTGRAATFQASLQAMIRDCEADPICAQAYPDLRADVARLIPRLHDGMDMTADIQTANGIQNASVSDEEVVNWIERNFKVVETIAHMPRALTRLANGDHAFLVSQLKGAAPGTVNALGPFSRGLFLSVACAEDAPFIDVNVERTASAGTLIGLNMVESILESCSSWPVSPAAPEFKKPAATSASLLLVNGDFDATTGYYAAEMASMYAPNSRVIRLKNRSHRLTYKIQECFGRLMMQYLRSADAWSLDASCADQTTRPPFTLPNEE